MSTEPHDEQDRHDLPWSGNSHAGPVPAPRYGQYLPGREGTGPAETTSRTPGASPRTGEPVPTGQWTGAGPGLQGPHRPRRRTGWPVTWVIIGLCMLVWGLQWLTRLFTPYDLSTILGYAPALTQVQPWRLLTSAFVHAMPSPVHLLLNMYTLYLFGRMLEPLLGAWRFAALFLLSALGGSVGVLLLGNPWVLVIGASGGIFGLFGAMFVFVRHFRQDITPIAVLIAINLAFGFLVGGVAWQAHLGGLVTGAVVGLLMLPGLRKHS
ncbi:rhomboid family intramembrane serine protease [Kocuria sp.]|uniref:rhomboid family intramembrane serine protease n=1 Tax=Kocuria sp. TaxID=1871328 RepID=UPI0026DB5AF4|nr:rhomboid family intramembrane serine protease [Kocuria sp.]MDO4919129.1 rhomboid family intramembrane serine protease [Kocuria sp.]